MNDDLTPIEEQALDALLVETLNNVGPPDLSAEILLRVHQTPSDVGSIVHRNRDSDRETQSSSVARQVTIALTAIAALAASLLLVVWFRSGETLPDSSPRIAANDDAIPPDLSHVAANPLATPDEASRQEVADASPVRRPPRGVPLVIESTVESDPPSPPQRDVGTAPPVSPKPLAPVVLVSKQVDENVHEYWSAIGIEPVGDAGVDETVRRMSDVLGVSLSPEVIDDPSLLAARLAEPSVAREISFRWLQQVTQRGLSRLEPEAREGLLDGLAACFGSEGELDRTLAGWISGASQHASAFYAAISSGARHAGDDHTVRRMASFTMNVDLRCTQCHDSYIEGTGLQQDYWAFAALLRRGVVSGPDGQLTVADSPQARKPLFYSLPDGRERVAEPAVATAWMNSGSGQPIRSVSEWAKKLVGSPELAQGVVNSLWQLVHGQPLRGRVVDPISAPHDESLDRLEESLVQDLMDSRFDVARTLALIMTSPTTRRGVPTPLLPENALVADESEMQAAMHAVDAFAAALPPRISLSMNQRLDQAKRAIGVKLDSDGRPFVAQLGNAGESSGSPNRDAGTSNALSTDFPQGAKSLPVQWLESIKDEKSQVEHLGYLAGLNQVPANVLAVVDETRAANVSNEQTLHRVWWMLRP